MKFVRQMAAVLLVVAVVVALGVAWERSGEASWIAVPRGGGPASLPAALPGHAEGDDNGHHEQRRG